MSCQVSNVTRVQVCWERFYASVKAKMIKPFSILVYFAIEPFRKLAQMINELSVKILNTPFNLAFVLRIRRMSKMRLNAMQTAPSLPLLLKLRSMVRKNSLRKPLLLLQHRYCFSRRQLMVKLLRTNDKPAVIINANQKPVLLAPNSEGSFKVDLPQLIRRLCPEKLPALKFLLIAVLIIPCENLVYGFSGQHYSLNAIC